MGHDTAQSIIDQIVQSHESGGRAQMFAAPSMRIGAGFMNPMATARKCSSLARYGICRIKAEYDSVGMEPGMV